MPEFINGNVGYEIDFGPFSIFWMHSDEKLKTNGVPSCRRDGKGIARLRVMRWKHRD